MNDEEAIEFGSELLDTLSGYFKALRDADGWIHYYISRLQLKPVYMSFTETQPQLFEKVRDIFDTMELAFLYCRLVNVKDYSQATHMQHRVNSARMNVKFEQLTPDQFQTLRGQLKADAQFGAN